MNEDLQERFGRSKTAVKRPNGQAHVMLQQQQLNEKIRDYFKQPEASTKGGSWLQQPELPSSAEILDIDVGGSNSSSNVELATNRPQGAWASKEEYLSAHYELLREDAVRPLREAVQQAKATPQAKEDAFGGNISIYEKVHICSVKCSTRGMAIKVTFSLFRAGKKILWEQSKRLISGALVVLTPADDHFESKAIVATVAARPLEGLRLNPPEVELFIARPDEIELDPSQEFWMVEHRGSMYEADRHTLLALQRMMRESFPLHEHLLGVQSAVAPPPYVQVRPELDLTSALINNKHETYESVDVLRGWPAQPQSDLDASQLAALRRILTKQLAIVQGPPGTGKTYISVQAIRIMLANRRKDEPPIIIACQTNHAVDQLLNHIADFEPDFVRLGGRSKDKGVVKARTLHEVKKLTAQNRLPGSLIGSARKKMREMTKEFGVLLTPLKADKTPLDFRLLANFGLLTERQAETLEAGASQWVQSTLSNPNEARQSPFIVWLNKQLVVVPPKQQAEDFGFEYEEADMEYEQLKDMEAENANKDDDDFEELYGESFAVADNFTCRKTPGVTVAKVQQALKEADMWKIPEAIRPSIYRHLQSEMKKVILTKFRTLTKKYQEATDQRRIGQWEENEQILKKQKIIGMTTTGLSKYRGLLAALQPQVVLIEEAAEVLEAPVAVGCLPSLQHLILVGDHKQLRPHCKVKDHEDKPFYLNVSLFERLVNNDIEYDTLTKQRRMIPEIRRILYPIYKNIIKDHASVLDPIKRPPVPGMGGINSWFFTHQWYEQRDDQSSAYNPAEADMIVGFVKYLVYNGMSTENITILTFYNGQRKKFMGELRKDVDLTGQRFNVVTVDSYQGEENDVVILSLVRSNDRDQIGFLDIDNRVCVALSRAKRGFYIFGNGQLLYNFKTWKRVINIMANEGPKADRLQTEPANRLDDSFPVRCNNHNQLTKIHSAADWENIKGGCQKKCNGKLPCGHECPLTCHPFSHELVNCLKPCKKSLPCCGRPCETHCGASCVCKACKVEMKPVDDQKEPLPMQSSAAAWQVFAKDEPDRYAEAIESANASRRTSPEKSNKKTADLVVDLPVTDGPMQLLLEDGNDTYRGLSGVGDLSSTSSTTVSDAAGGGGRKKWTTRMKSNDSVIAVGSTGNETGDKKDWSKEESLLD